MWRIGNNQKTIWKDKWIQSPMSNSSQSPISQLDVDARVTGHIDDTNHYWKRDLITQTFSLDEVKVITAIPISIIGREDK